MRDAPPSRSLLVVEDSKADRARYRQQLESLADRWTIVEAETGAEGLERLREGRPDCILLDYYLPDMEGTDFLERLRHDTDLPIPDIPVAILTGSDDWRLAREALEWGADDYVLKGTISATGLVRVIENAIEKHRLRAELEQQRAALEVRTWQLELLRKELQEKVGELSEAAQAREQFMAVMSHEMRTPLNAILGYTELLEIGLHGPLEPDQAALLERVRVGGRHLLDLINDVLDLARADARQIELELGPVDLAAVSEEIGQLLEREAAEKGVKIRVESPDDDFPMCRGDLRRVRQIITNLVGNAVKFTDDGEIRIIFTEQESTVSVAVRDTGVGIEPELLPLVFERFFQADGSYTREKGGSGLGLAIARRLARLMGGDVEAESTPGEGSCFTLVLPVDEEASALRSATGVVALEGVEPTPVAAIAVSPAPNGAVPVSLDGDSVAVVAFSDDEDGLTALREQVTPVVRLVCTTDPENVSVLAVAEAAGLVVLDMSAGAGWTAAHSLQDVPEMKTTAVLLLPGIPRPSGRDGTPGLDLGWVSLVPKPFTEEQLTNAVSRATGGWDEEGEIEEPSGGLEVLLVDDDHDSRRVALSFLKGAGLRVREVENGESALVAMRQREPAVVVLDLMMPVLDGFGVLAAMRADPRLASIPVVVLSAKSLSEAERRFLARSAARVLQKGQHRLADVAALVTRAAQGAHRNGGTPPA